MDALRSFSRLSLIHDRSDFERGEVSSVISTGALARDNAIIDQSGWELQNYSRNPVVLWMHDDGSSFAGSKTSPLPVGRALSTGVERGLRAEDDEVEALVSRALLDKEDEFAAGLLGKIERGFVHSTSVRWNPLDPPRLEKRTLRGDDGEPEEREVIVFPRNELLEWSFVSIPADPGATILRADGGRPDYAELIHPHDPTVAELAASFHDALDREAPVLTDADRVALAGLHRALASYVEPERSPEPELPTSQIVELLLRMERRMAAVEEQPDVRPLVVAALAKATGRSEAAIESMI